MQLSDCPIAAAYQISSRRSYGIGSRAGSGGDLSGGGLSRVFAARSCCGFNSRLFAAFVINDYIIGGVNLDIVNVARLA